LVNAVYMMLQY